MAHGEKIVSASEEDNEEVYSLECSLEAVKENFPEVKVVSQPLWVVCIH